MLHVRLATALSGEYLLGVRRTPGMYGEAEPPISAELRSALKGPMNMLDSISMQVHNTLNSAFSVDANRA